MDFGLKGKVALVLASSRGLGRASAEALAAEGARVAVVGRTLEGLADVVETIEDGGGTVIAIPADLSDPAATEKIHEAVVEAFGPVDVLVNNNGGPPAKLAQETTAEDLRRSFEPMVASLVAMTGLVLPGMRARGFGRIITIASSGTVQPLPNLALSNALRASLVGYMKTLAAEVAADGITVNMVLPGRVDTERLAELDAANAKRQGRDIEEIRHAALAQIPAGRYGQPAEFGAVVAFLASRQASYVTGSQIRVDGGAVRGV